MVCKVIGVREANFSADDGTEVLGYRVSISTPIDPTAGKGFEAENHYVSKRKLDSWGITDAIAMVGQSVDMF